MENIYSSQSQSPSRHDIAPSLINPQQGYQPPDVMPEVPTDTLYTLRLPEDGTGLEKYHFTDLPPPGTNRYGASNAPGLSTNKFSEKLILTLF